MSIPQKRVLITNDDGIRAPGLVHLIKALKNLPIEITVIVPDQQHSGVGKAVTFDDILRVKKVSDFPVANCDVSTISGTPADAVIFGAKNHIDLVISGINAGENTSIHSILTSGTCAAAFEAAFFNIPAIAFSLKTPFSEFFDYKENNDFQLAADFSARFVKQLLFKSFPNDVSFINVNYPADLTETTPIVESDGLAFVKYRNYALEKMDPRKLPYYWIWGDLLEEFPRASDTDLCIMQKVISISAISLKDWCKTQKYGLDRVSNS